MFYDKNPDKVMDKAMTNVGALFADEVEGRVATEIDIRNAHDRDRMVEQAHHLLGLYQELKVPKEKIILQFPGTWEGIQAARQLEQENVATLVSLVYSFVQAVAAAQAGVSVVQPNMGRLNDWYNSHPGVIRDPKGPREDSGYSSRTDPGHAFVKRIYNYCKKYHPKTLVMASGIRTKEDALAVAGCDFVIVGPRVLKALDDAPTVMGYNDGLTAESTQTGFERILSTEAAQSCDIDSELATVVYETFEEGLGLAGKELLTQSLDGLLQHVERVMPFFQGMAVGTE